VIGKDKLATMPLTIFGKINWFKEAKRDEWDIGANLHGCD
jgi:hypothetical protein